MLLNHLKKIKRKVYLGFLKFIKYPLKGCYYRKIAKLSDEDIIPSHRKYYLGMVAIFKGEDDYLVEWIEFHKMMGVEHFILYDNGLQPNSKNLLKPYIESGLVTHILFPTIPTIKYGTHVDMLSTQQLAYADCIIRFRHHFQYLLELDIDEFMFPKNQVTIVDVLKKYKPENIKGIEVNWLNFGNNGHINKPNGLVIENYIMTSGHISQNTVKSICNTQYLSKLFKYTNVHHWSYRISIFDIVKKIVTGYPRVIKGDEANNLLQLNHYKTKSKEEYLNKSKINRGGWMTGSETEEKFIALNKQLNLIEDKNIFRFVQKLKDIINNKTHD